MLQLIAKLFSSKKEKTKKAKGYGKDRWAEKQIKEMGKLRGRLILM
jgi:hypothetical protein